eukprot:Gb_35624 [translate_table: standard]
MEERRRTTVTKSINDHNKIETTDLDDRRLTIRGPMMMSKGLVENNSHIGEPELEESKEAEEREKGDSGESEYWRRDRELGRGVSKQQRSSAKDRRRRNKELRERECAGDYEVVLEECQSRRRGE